MKAIIKIKCENGSNEIEVRDLEKLGKFTKQFDRIGTDYLLEFVTE